MDAQRNHRQLRQHDARDAQALSQGIGLRLQQAHDVVFDRIGGADHCVPGLDWRGEEAGDRVHGRGRSRGVGDAAQAPGPVAESGPLPGRFADARAGVIDQTRLGEA